MSAQAPGKEAVAVGNVDDVFRAAMKEEEINPVTRFVMWLGVRVGGASYYQEVAQDSPDDLYKN